MIDVGNSTSLNNQMLGFEKVWLSHIKSSVLLFGKQIANYINKNEYKEYEKANLKLEDRTMATYIPICPQCNTTVVWGQAKVDSFLLISSLEADREEVNNPCW